jgi:predicted nucleic acid-binding protein
MNRRTRFIFDTNGLISGLLFKSSKPGQAFQYALKNGDILLSPQTLAELSEVLSRKKFDRYTNLKKECDKWVGARHCRAPTKNLCVANIL